jgi:hypothetical protein
LVVRDQLIPDEVTREINSILRHIPKIVLHMIDRRVCFGLKVMQCVLTIRDLGIRLHLGTITDVSSMRAAAKVQLIVRDPRPPHGDFSKVAEAAIVKAVLRGGVARRDSFCCFVMGKLATLRKYPYAHLLKGRTPEYFFKRGAKAGCPTCLATLVSMAPTWRCALALGLRATERGFFDLHNELKCIGYSPRDWPATREYVRMQAAGGAVRAMCEWAFCLLSDPVPDIARARKILESAGMEAFLGLRICYLSMLEDVEAGRLRAGPSLHDLDLDLYIARRAKEDARWKLVDILWRHGLDEITPDEAVRALSVLADRGDARAAMAAGLVLDEIGMCEAANPWFRRAFAGHVIGAGAKTVSLECRSSGLRRNVSHFEADALAGIGEATRWLGFMHARGGVIAEAVRWLRKSGGLACYHLVLEQFGWAALVSRGVPEAERELFLLARR